MDGGVTLKKVITMILLVSLLTPFSAYATPTYVETENVVVSADTAVVDADTVIVNADTVIIEGETVILKGTILQSINYENPEITYKPPVAMSLFLEGVLKTDFQMGAVELSAFNKAGSVLNNSYEDYYSEVPGRLSREDYLLGGDISIVRDSYDFERGIYHSTSLQMNDELNYHNAVMMLYKAIGKSEFTHHFNFKGHQSGKNVPVGDSPFNIGKVSMIDHSRYYTEVFTTRTNPEIYFKVAKFEGIVDPTLEEVDTVSTVDFIRMVHRKLEREGEPVLTEEEMTMMLMAHGRELPLYLTDSDLVSVKYLLARGIIDPSIKFNNNTISAKDAIDILLRAAKPELRLTFKNVQYPYIESVVRQGYAPVDMSLGANPFGDIDIVVEEAEIANYYDYYIVRDADTIFRRTDGREEYYVYVSNVWDNISDTPFEGSSVQIVEGGKYYHLRVPLQIEASPAFRNGTFTVNSLALSDLPDNWKIEPGGGVYRWNKEKGKFDRSPFSIEFANNLIDKERKLEAINSKEFSALLSSKARKATFSFRLTGSSTLSDILWEGAPITESYPNLRPDSNGIYSVTIEADDPYKFLLRNLSYTSKTSGDDLVQAYAVDNNTVLVSLRWLRSRGLVDGVLELKKDKLWYLYSDEENAYINLEGGFIVAGQTVTEIADEDKSVFIVRDPLSGDVLIDYRVVNNMKSGFLMVRDSNGAISLTSGNEQIRVEERVPIYPILGEGLESMNRTRVTGTVSIEHSYPTANWIIYKSRKGSLNQDYLLVFKPSESTSGSTLDRFNISQIQNTKVEVYEIGMSTISDSGADRNILLPGAQVGKNGIVRDTSKGLYMYQYAVVTDLQKAFDDYMKDNPEIHFPIVRYDGKFVNLNSNLYGNTPNNLSSYPKELFNKLVTTSIGRNVKPVQNQFTLAMAGAVAVYYPYSYESLVKMNRQSTIYFGSMPGAKVTTTSTDSYGSTVTLSVGDMIVSSKRVQDASTDFPLKEVFKGSRNSVFVYGFNSSYRLVAEGILPISSVGSRWITSILSTGNNAFFDWESYRFSQIFTKADEYLTTIYNLLLGLAPRIFIVIFTVYLALTLVADNKLVRRFSNRVFDPYKIISFGITSIEEVRFKKTFVQTTLGLVMVVLIPISVIPMVGWLVAFIQSLLTR